MNKTGLRVNTSVKKLGGSNLKNKMADTKFFFSKVVPLDPIINTGNLKLISAIVLH